MFQPKDSDSDTPELQLKKEENLVAVQHDVELGGASVGLEVAKDGHVCNSDFFVVANFQFRCK